MRYPRYRLTLTMVVTPTSIGGQMHRKDRSFPTPRASTDSGQLHQLRWQARLSCMWIAVAMLVGTQPLFGPVRHSVGTAIALTLAGVALADTAVTPTSSTARKH